MTPASNITMHHVTRLVAIGMSGAAWLMLANVSAYAAEGSASQQGTVPPAATAPAAAGTGAERGTETVTASAAGAELMVGDKLRVSFFEQLDLGRGGDAGMSADSRTFYQRLDLTGEHLVDADGTISIPLLGRFTVARHTPEELVASIVEAYGAAMGRTGQVDIAILERKPVFVTGIVKSPGSFRFEPGMVALQAVALAGGYDRGTEAAARLIDAQRERERHDQATERLTWLTARRERLIAQRDQAANAPALPNPGESEAAAGEVRIFAAELAARSETDGLKETTIAASKQQIASIGAVMTLISDQIDVRSERARVLQQMQGRGVMSLETLWGAQKEVGDLMMEKERLQAELSSAEHGILRVQAEAKRQAADQRLQIERELTAVEEEINLQTAIIESSRMVGDALETVASGVEPGATLSLTILRRTPKGTLTIEADETTDLLPGDVVKVDAVPQAAAFVASTKALVR